MLIGQSPFAGEDEEALFAAIQRERVYFPKWISESAVSVLTQVQPFFLFIQIFFSEGYATDISLLYPKTLTSIGFGRFFHKIQPNNKG